MRASCLPRDCRDRVDERLASGGAPPLDAEQQRCDGAHLSRVSSYQPSELSLEHCPLGAMRMRCLGFPHGRLPALTSNVHVALSRPSTQRL